MVCNDINTLKQRHSQWRTSIRFDKNPLDAENAFLWNARNARIAFVLPIKINYRISTFEVATLLHPKNDEIHSMFSDQKLNNFKIFEKSNLNMLCV